MQNEERYLADKQVANRYGVSRVTIWRWVAKGDFPKPEKLSPGCSRWRLSKLTGWDAKRS